MRTVTLPNEELLTEVIEHLSQGKSVTLKAKGSSMKPAIVGGRDSVVLQKAEMLRTGDIVLAKVAPQRFVLHRIIRIDNGLVTLTGDGNIGETEQCRKENIFGKVVSIIRKGKQIDCNKKTERLKADIWRLFLPLRRYLLALHRGTQRMHTEAHRARKL